CDHHGERAGPLAEDLVWDARVCQGRERRLLLSERAEVQDAVRDVRLQRQSKPGRRRHVADLVRPDGVDRRQRGKDRCAREESGELNSHFELTWPRSVPSAIITRSASLSWRDEY